MGKIGYASAVFAALVGVSTAASAEEWALRSIYQVMTDRFALPDGATDKDCDLMQYCGGTWTGIINKLDYIQGMGFNAIQISPVVENIPDDTEYGAAYHGYWPVNNYAINTKFGTEQDLKDLAKALHDRDMYLMVDVVINDMAQAIDGDMPKPIDYSKLVPFNDEKYYHPYCNITNYEDQKIAQDCWLGSTNVALPDLDTESDEVIKMTGDWIVQLIANYSIDGLRIDAAKHVNDDFLPPFVKAADVFTLGEVYTGITLDMCRYQQKELVSGLPNYLDYFPMIRAFTAGAMKELSKQKTLTAKECNDTTVLGTFAENHDLPRFASMVDDITLAKNALSYVLLNDGIPTVYQGQEQHFSGNYSPYNRENLWSSEYKTDVPLYNLTATLNKLRNHAISVDSNYAKLHSEELYLDDSTMCTRKGPDGVQIVACFSNQGSKGGEYQLSVPKAFAANEEVMEIFSCETATANNEGNVTALMNKGEPRAWFPVANLKGSGICGVEDKEKDDGNGKKKNSGNSLTSGLGGMGLAVLVGVLGVLVL